MLASNEMLSNSENIVPLGVEHREIESSDDTLSSRRPFHANTDRPSSPELNFPLRTDIRSILGLKHQKKRTMKLQTIETNILSTLDILQSLYIGA